MTRGDSASPPHLLGLLGRYRILGLIVFFLFLAFILVYLGAKMFERYLVGEAREVRAKYIAVVLEHTTLPEDFRKAQKGLQWETFRAKMAPLLSLPEVVRVKAYNEEGERVWSDLAAELEVPSPPEKNPDLRDALAGRIVANISHPDEKEENRFEREAFGTLMELYVPLFSAPGKKAAGVVEVYLNIAPLYATIRKTHWFLALAFFGGMGLVLCALALGSRRVLAVMGRQHQNLQKQEAIQKLLKELSQDISSLDVGSLLKKLTLKVCEFFRVDGSDVRLAEDGRWFLKASIGIDPAPYSRRRDAESPRGEYGSGWIAEKKTPLVIRDILDAKGIGAGETVRNLGFRGYLGVPIISKGSDVIGVLRALTYKPREFTREEIDLLQQLANGAAIAIENARLFEEARRKSQELESAYQAKSDFLNTMAHELRTPLNVIIGTEQLVTDGFYGDLTDGQKKGLEPLGRNAEDLLNLINGILDLARLEARRVPLQVKEFGLGGLMEELEASFAPLAREKGLGLKFGAVNGMKLRSDRSKVKEVLQNLVGNAVKYTDRGEVTVCAERDGEAERGGIVFLVRDTGIGMKAEELGRIFEPFYMVEGVDRRKYPGSGLGLSIVKRMVELLGGEIAVESEWGKGSTFKVVLPSLT